MRNFVKVLLLGTVLVSAGDVWAIDLDGYYRDAVAKDPRVAFRTNRSDTVVHLVPGVGMLAFVNGVAKKGDTTFTLGSDGVLTSSVRQAHGYSLPGPSYKVSNAPDLALDRVSGVETLSNGTTVLKYTNGSSVVVDNKSGGVVNRNYGDNRSGGAVKNTSTSGAGAEFNSSTGQISAHAGDGNGADARLTVQEQNGEIRGSGSTTNGSNTSRGAFVVDGDTAATERIVSSGDRTVTRSQSADATGVKQDMKYTNGDQSVTKSQFAEPDGTVQQYTQVKEGDKIATIQTNTSERGVKRTMDLPEGTKVGNSISDPSAPGSVTTVPAANTPAVSLGSRPALKSANVEMVSINGQLYAVQTATDSNVASYNRMGGATVKAGDKFVTLDNGKLGKITGDGTVESTNFFGLKTTDKAIDVTGLSVGINDKVAVSRDGNITVRRSDGSIVVKNPNGAIVVTRKDGTQLIGDDAYVALRTPRKEGAPDVALEQAPVKIESNKVDLNIQTDDAALRADVAADKGKATVNAQAIAAVNPAGEDGRLPADAPGRDATNEVSINLAADENAASATSKVTAVDAETGRVGTGEDSTMIETDRTVTDTGSVTSINPEGEVSGEAVQNLNVTPEGKIKTQDGACVGDTCSASEIQTDGQGKMAVGVEDTPEGFGKVQAQGEANQEAVNAHLLAANQVTGGNSGLVQYQQTTLNKHNIDMLGFDTVFGEKSLWKLDGDKQPKFDADTGTIKFTDTANGKPSAQQQKLLNVHGVTVNEDGMVVSNGTPWGDATIKAMKSLNYWDGNLLDLKNASKDVRTAQSKVDKLQKAYDKANSKIKAVGEDGGKSQKKAVEAKQKLEAAEKELEEAQQKKDAARAAADATIADVKAVETAAQQRALSYIPEEPDVSPNSPQAGMFQAFKDDFTNAINAGDYDAADAAVDSALSQGLINQDTANNMKDATTEARNAQGEAGKMAEEAEANEVNPEPAGVGADLFDALRTALMVLTPMLAEDHLSLRDNINIKAGEIGPAVGAVDSTALGTDQGEDASRATTVVGGAQLVTQLLQQATVDLGLLSEEVKFDEEETEERPANVGTTDISSTGGQQESYREEQETDTSSDDVTDEDDGDDALSEAKRQEIERRRAELMKQYVNAGIQIAEGMNAISNDFSARAEVLGQFSEGVQTESAGYGLAQDVGRYVLFETLRGLALSSTQMGVQASRLLFEQEVTDVK